MGKTINFSDGNQGIYFNNSSLEKVAVQVVTDGTYDGTTTTATLQESVDGSNWHNVEDSAGAAVTITLAAASTSYILKSGIVYGDKVRCLIGIGNATTGTAVVSSSYKA